MNINWSSRFAYAIGLLTADGCLLNDGRHIDFTSKDHAQVKTFKRCLGLKTKIGIKHSGIGNPYHRVQFSDVLFYRFLIDIGLLPAKSKTIKSVSVPDQYFFDFVRGYFDGDGSSSTFYDSQWKNSLRFYISFASASPIFLGWLRIKLCESIGIKGFINDCGKSALQLRYGKRESTILAEHMYYSPDVCCLRRKSLKIKKTLCIIYTGRSGEIGKHAAFRTQSP